MATLIPDFEEFITYRGVPLTVGFHRVTLASSSDTVTVPTLASTTPAQSVAELDDGNNDTGVTVSTSDSTTVTITGGTAGGRVDFVTLHGNGVINSSVTDS